MNYEFNLLDHFGAVAKAPGGDARRGWDDNICSGPTGRKIRTDVLASIMQQP